MRAVQEGTGVVTIDDDSVDFLFIRDEPEEADLAVVFGSAVRDDLETKFLITRVVHTGECPEEILSSAGGSVGGDQPRRRPRPHAQGSGRSTQTPRQPRRSTGAVVRSSL